MLEKYFFFFWLSNRHWFGFLSFFDTFYFSSCALDLYRNEKFPEKTAVDAKTDPTGEKKT